LVKPRSPPMTSTPTGAPGCSRRRRWPRVALEARRSRGLLACVHRIGRIASRRGPRAGSMLPRGPTTGWARFTATRSFHSSRRSRFGASADHHQRARTTASTQWRGRRRLPQENCGAVGPVPGAPRETVPASSPAFSCEAEPSQPVYPYPTRASIGHADTALTARTRPL